MTNTETPAAPLASFIAGASSAAPLLLTLELAPGCDECDALAGEACRDAYCYGSMGAPEMRPFSPAWL